MKIVSIDVGLKNLAYCLFEADLTTGSYTIEQWAVLDLVRTPIFTCKCALKNGKPCVSKATYEKNGDYYCNKHAKLSTEYSIPPHEFGRKKYKTMTKLRIHELMDTYQIPYDAGDKRDTLLSLLDSHIEAKYYHIMKPDNGTYTDLVTIGTNIRTLFDAEFSNVNLECVLIENQLATVASKMTTVQGMIIQYFLMNNLTSIHLVSACNKLKHWTDKKTTYAERKKLSIHVMKQLLSENTLIHKWTSTFMSHKKKDDMADCMLQGLWYIREHTSIIVSDVL